MVTNNGKLEELLDRHGSDFDTWPDRDHAREALKSAEDDPEFHRSVTATKRVETGIQRVAQSDSFNRLGNDGAYRIEPALLHAVGPDALMRRAFSGPSLARLAATLVVACVLGVIIEDVLPTADIPSPEAHDQLLLGHPDHGTTLTVGGGNR